MGQKTHPIGLRLGIIKQWEANWFDERNMASKLTEDIKVRSYIKSRLKKAGVSRLILERTAKQLRITINTSRPGVIIGRSGKDITQLEEEIKKFTSRDDVKILISEIKRPELDAYLVAENIAQQLEGRISFRRAMKQSVSSAMRMGASGIRIMCAGRLGGAEMARTEQYKEGRIPLHTLRADIDYAIATAQTIYGSIGVKVWICKGEIIGKQLS
ncbi:MAG: 30S ribosomal protein S3 [Ignavibacteria bacterium GWB2_35_12]|nr:MAG: 30S ribosomal protein S3 [Ignavibacteria bacterium GWA2_35_8]OGU39767.1 MAG: 30S ribosomal protein S3 [Ignavibacteria bacterium GWB2_35_12]OGU95538.1 MAG: 30S ribosomal protein S3 [Ignavibacteria bacterium RIFOXYA2_FULL_35_10]OGV21342.1 MAG: 30S ribosomal protein S3 [Ignavibacteria bacterium RIFOXYC2_FULL_35_21]